MIVEGLVNLIVGLFSFIGSLMPEIEPPAFMADLASAVATVAGTMAPLSVWLPFGAARTAVLVVISAAAVALGVRLVRMILSLLTGGGGAGA